jgi:hypothetical protein
MNSVPFPGRSVTAEAVYSLLNPIPFGCFVAALISMGSTSAAPICCGTRLPPG